MPGFFPSYLPSAFDSHSMGKVPTSSEKLFQCTGYEGCSMTFKRLENLTRHKRKHTGEKPFRCNICLKNFSRMDNLKQHVTCVHYKRKSKTINQSDIGMLDPRSPRNTVPRTITNLPDNATTNPKTKTTTNNNNNNSVTTTTSSSSTVTPPGTAANDAQLVKSAGTNSRENTTVNPRLTVNFLLT